jgi:protein-S-isoprenylcysteine O-methyltransferase Ste14
MNTGIFQSAVTLAALVLFYIADFFLISRYDHERRAEGSGRSWDYTLLALVLAAVLVIQPLLLPVLGLQIDARWGAWLQALGILFIAASLAVQIWARLHLRQFYAERVELQPDHYVIDTGPYAHVRHPLFTSFFLFVVGLFLVNPALPTLAVMGYAFWDFGRAAKKEEELLGQELPGYAEYMACTPRYVPVPWRRERS